MTHSTTTATVSTYILEKYSRFNPGNEEWQHFVNPVIQLTLESKKALIRDELESVRLRVSWLVNGPMTGLDQRDVVFEDIDLLSFSSRNSPQSLPLKAVYRDAVVGIRYLDHRLITADSPPVYRRFQITFTSSSAASQFIDSIRSVCPCKVNPTPVPGRIASVQTKRPENFLRHSPLLGRSSTMAFTQSAIPSSPFSSIHTPSSIVRQSSPPRLTSSPNFFALPSSQIDLPPSSTYINFETSSRPSTASSTLPQVIPHPFFPTPTNPPRSTPNSTFSLTQNLPGNSSLPDPSPPSSSMNNPAATMMPPPPSPPQIPPSPAAAATAEIGPTATVPDPQSSPDQDALFASLCETTTLYNLSRVELEKLVAKVVREEGFAKLLEDLDSMWRVKAFLGR